MTKAAVVSEATGRHVASFVLGSVATLTVVLLLQQRPEELSRPTAALHFLGRRNGTSSMITEGGGGGVAAAGGGDPVVDVTKQQQQQPSPDANAATAAGPSLPPSGAATHRKEEEEEEEVKDDDAAAAANNKAEEEEDEAASEPAAAEFRGLASAVSRAASPDDRTVILTCVNRDWAAPGSLLDLFLESFRVGDGTARLLDQVLVVAMDPAAMSRCREVHRHCYHYTMPGTNIDFSSAKFFLSKEYLELVWSKLKLQRRVLQLGYNFLFTDVDILWFRNPFKHITVYADMSVSSDVFFGDPDNIGNFPNTGFFHVRPNNRTIAATRAWHEARSRFPGLNEQPVFNAIKKGLVRDLGLRVRYIDPAFVGGFCSYGKDLGKICTMHANCCVGLGAKLKDLRTVLDDWKRYTSMPPWVRHTANWTVPGACIH